MTASELKPESTKQPATPRRRWYQFSLRTACALFLVVSLLLGAFAWWRDRAERQRKVVEELRGLGADVNYRYFSLSKSPTLYSGVNSFEEFSICAWLRHWLGEDFVYDVYGVRMSKPVPSETTNSVMKLIKELPRLKELRVDGDAVSGGELDALPCLITLEWLSLESRSGRRTGLARSGGLTDSDFAPLERAIRLQVLELEYQPVGDDGIRCLRDCSLLQSLSLKGTAVSDIGLETLCDKVRLRTIDLSQCHITDAGFQSLRNLNDLQSLYIGGNELTGKGLADMGYKPELHTIEATWSPFDDTGLASLREFPKLKVLWLDGTKVTGSGLSCLKNHKSLEAVHLGRCPITDASLGDFRIPEGWQIVSLRGTRITDQGIASLRFPKSLVECSLQDTLITDDSLASFESLPKLQSLSLTNTQVTVNGIKHFQKKQPSCIVFP